MAQVPGVSEGKALLVVLQRSQHEVVRGCINLIEQIVQDDIQTNTRDVLFKLFRPTQFRHLFLLGRHAKKMTLFR
jgi:hypothetical protein